MANYKMREVVREFKIPSPVNAAVMVPRIELSCGHVVRGVISPTKSQILAKLMHGLAGTRPKHRCFECAKPMVKLICSGCGGEKFISDKDARVFHRIKCYDCEPSNAFPQLNPEVSPENEAALLS